MQVPVIADEQDDISLTGCQFHDVSIPNTAAPAEPGPCGIKEGGDSSMCIRGLCDGVDAIRE